MAGVIWSGGSRECRVGRGGGVRRWLRLVDSGLFCFGGGAVVVVAAMGGILWER